MLFFNDPKWLIVLLLITYCSIVASQSLSTATANTIAPLSTVVDYCTTSTNKSTTALEDANILPYFIAIVGNFGKILLDCHNTPHVVACVTIIIDNIIALAHEVTRSPQTKDYKKRLITKILLKNPRCATTPLKSFTYHYT